MSMDLSHRETSIVAESAGTGLLSAISFCDAAFKTANLRLTAGARIDHGLLPNIEISATGSLDAHDEASGTAHGRLIIEVGANTKKESTTRKEPAVERGAVVEGSDGEATLGGTASINGRIDFGDDNNESDVDDHSHRQIDFSFDLTRTLLGVLQANGTVSLDDNREHLQ